jgi:hypothetical protein
MKEEHIKNSNAGQETPGLTDLHYLAYLSGFTQTQFDAHPLSKEQWLAQYNMLRSQLLREG